MVSPELTVALTLADSVTVLAVKLDTVWVPLMPPGVVESETLIPLAIQSGTLPNVRIALELAVDAVVAMVLFIAPMVPSALR